MYRTSRTSYSYKVAIFVPLILAVIMIAIFALNDANTLSKNVNIEYARMTTKVENSIKVLGAMNYIFSTNFANGSPLQSGEDQYIRALDSEGFCSWFPARSKIQSAYRTDSLDVLRVDYAVKGYKESCDPNSQVYQDISSKLVIASSFAYLSTLESYIAGLYYISPKGYLVASPAANVKLFHKADIPVLIQRNYWRDAQDGSNDITLNGPHTDVISGKETLTVSTGLYNSDQFEGTVILDIMISKLSSAADPLSKNIRFSRDDGRVLPEDAWLPKSLLIEGITTKQIMYFHWSWMDEFTSFVSSRSLALIGLLLLYIFTVSGLIYAKLNYERHYFRELSQRDPMTSLLNRRGLELAYKSVFPQDFEGVAIFDIDDFKKINDTYGHDVGDEVICYVGQTLHRNTRAADIVSRFGGEEFVVYMQGNDERKMIDAVLRVQQEVSKGSTDIVSSGFSVSGGFVVKPVTEKSDLDDLLKQADEKLYIAKQSGKNRIIV